MPSREDMLARVARRGAPEHPDPLDELEEARSERPGA